MSKPLYKRILIKVSGESLKGDSAGYFDKGALAQLVFHVKASKSQGCQVALVIGGGNIFRGKESAIDGLCRADADAMGMLATLMNAVTLRSVFQQQGVKCSVLSGLSVPALCDNYTREKSLGDLDSGMLVIFAGGTGSPFFTTDTAATLRALEMNCDALLKLTKVDGVYDKDPVLFKEAHRFEKLTFQEVLVHHYAVMDATAIALAREGNLPVLVGSFSSEKIISEVLAGKGRFTVIEEGAECKKTST